MLLGAGTVLSIDQADRAISAGAQFIMSPGLNPKVVGHCVEKDIPIIPGCATPSDIEQALEFGLSAVKFFPAEQAGGIEYIKAVSAPYPNVRFIPTGGINARNIRHYLAFDKVLACGGSWMAGADLIAARDFEKITALSREALMSLLDMRVTHTGINADSEEAALKAANFFAALFGFSVTNSEPSVFAGDSIEIVRRGGQGTQGHIAQGHNAHGHIAVGTSDITRALAYLERSGVELDYDSALRDSGGAVRGIYLKEEILGFAVRLLST